MKLNPTMVQLCRTYVEKDDRLEIERLYGIKQPNLTVMLKGYANCPPQVIDHLQRLVKVKHNNAQALLEEI